MFFQLRSLDSKRAKKITGCIRGLGVRMQQVVRGREGVAPTQFETMDDDVYNVPKMTHKPNQTQHNCWLMLPQLVYRIVLSRI